jgi:hypothetical protein
VLTACVDNPAENFLAREDLKGLFTERELRAIKDTVKEEVVANIDDIIWEFEDSFAGGQSPEEHFGDLRSALLSYLDDLRTTKTL